MGLEQGAAVGIAGIAGKGVVERQQRPVVEAALDLQPAQARGRKGPGQAAQVAHQEPEKDQGKGGEQHGMDNARQQEPETEQGQAQKHRGDRAGTPQAHQQVLAEDRQAGEHQPPGQCRRGCDLARKRLGHALSPGAAHHATAALQRTRTSRFVRACRLGR